MARRLKTTSDVRRYLASVINRLEAGQISETKAGRLGYLANILTHVIESSDLEERLKKLEAIIP